MDGDQESSAVIPLVRMHPVRGHGVNLLDAKTKRQSGRTQHHHNHIPSAAGSVATASGA